MNELIDRYKRPKIFTYIISWAQMHDNALIIANSILDSCDKVSIVYSDPDENFTIYNKHPIHLIRRNNDGFFSDKFNACMEDFSGDVLLIIHADCHSNDWNLLINSCLDSFNSFKSLGIWSPLIEWTAFDLSKTEVGKIKHTNLSLVIQTDTIVTAFSKKIISRLKKLNFTNNLYGWGIGWAANAYSLSCGHLSLVDRSIKVSHPKESKYKALEAARQRNEFLQQCSPQEIAQLSLMRCFMTRNGAKIL